MTLTANQRLALEHGMALQRACAAEAELEAARQQIQELQAELAQTQAAKGEAGDP